MGSANHSLLPDTQPQCNDASIDLDADAQGATSSPPGRSFGDYERLSALEDQLGVDLCRRLGLYRIPSDFLLSIVVPIFNERSTIAKVIESLIRVPLPKEIILVDDCSTDGTREILQPYVTANGFRVVIHDHNRGKGAAVRSGLEHIRGTVAVIQDADLEYDPSELPRLIQPLVEGKADAVFGSRFLGDGPHRVLYFWHYLGNRGLTTFSNMLTNLNLTDMETGYKAVRAEVMKRILPTLKQDRFGFEPELTAKLARENVRIYEVAISYSGRTYAEGKKIGWRDGLQALWCIVRYACAD